MAFFPWQNNNYNNNGHFQSTYPLERTEFYGEQCNTKPEKKVAFTLSHDPYRLKHTPQLPDTEPELVKLLEYHDMWSAWDSHAIFLYFKYLSLNVHHCLVSDLRNCQLKGKNISSVTELNNLITLFSFLINQRLSSDEQEHTHTRTHTHACTHTHTPYPQSHTHS